MVVKLARFLLIPLHITVTPGGTNQMHIVKTTLLAVALMATPVAASAATVLVDNSVDAIGLTPGFNASNTTGGQNFLSAVTFASGVTVGGFDIYSDFESQGGPNQQGFAVTLRIRGDDGGAPGASDLFTLTSTITTVDNIGSSTSMTLKRLHADFAATNLAAGNYWFGLSGTDEIGFNLAFNAPGANGLWILSGANNGGSLPDTLAAFRVLGTAGSVPEAATWVMLIAGFGLTGATMRRRRATAAA